MVAGCVLLLLNVDVTEKCYAREDDLSVNYTLAGFGH